VRMFVGGSRGTYLTSTYINDMSLPNKHLGNERRHLAYLVQFLRRHSICVWVCAGISGATTEGIIMDGKRRTTYGWGSRSVSGRSVTGRVGELVWNLSARLDHSVSLPLTRPDYNTQSISSTRLDHLQPNPTTHSRGRRDR
jgi:hypothetical protein